MTKLALKRAKRSAHVNKEPQRKRISFRRFWRKAHKLELPRREQRESAHTLWKTLEKRSLSGKDRDSQERISELGG